MPEPFTIAVLVSGRGSNLQSLIDAVASGALDVRIACVMSNEPGAHGLARARAAGIPTRVVPHRDYPDRASFERALAAALDACNPSLVVLAGFMRVLGPEFVQRYADRIINIHPSLLPAFPGLDTHQRAIDAGVAEHGCSVHFVTPELDGGPVIAQARVPVLAGDDAERLAARVLAEEHRLLPQVVGLIAAGRVHREAGRVRIDD